MPQGIECIIFFFALVGSVSLWLWGWEARDGGWGMCKRGGAVDCMATSIHMALAYLPLKLAMTTCQQSTVANMWLKSGCLFEQQPGLTALKACMHTHTAGNFHSVIVTSAQLPQATLFFKPCLTSHNLGTFCYQWLYASSCHAHCEPTAMLQHNLP